MKIKTILSLAFVAFVLFACSSDRENATIDEDKLGIIDADVESEETNLKGKALVADLRPGESELIERSFENAPPLIPHTTDGFLPIKMDNNICITCHLPDKAKETGAVPVSETHFMTLRPQPKLVNGKYVLPKHDSLVQVEIGKLNNLYFNCSQCHVPQTNVTVDIENLFSAEFREEFGLKKSGLKTKVYEGVK